MGNTIQNVHSSKMEDRDQAGSNPTTLMSIFLCSTPNSFDIYPFSLFVKIHQNSFPTKCFILSSIFLKAYTTNEQVPGAVENRMRKSDPAEYLNMTNPDNHSSITSKSFLGQQRPSLSEHERLGRYYVGNKVSGGF